jgi:hypothetical protein
MYWNQSFSMISFGIRAMLHHGVRFIIFWWIHHGISGQMIVWEDKLLPEIHPDRVEVHHPTIRDTDNVLAFSFFYPSTPYELGDIVFVGTRRHTE